MTEGQKFDCFYCSNSYESEEHMKFHLLECESRQNILEEFKNLFNSCTNCGTKFTRYDHLQRHVTTCQSRKETKMFQCYHCQKTFANKLKLYRHQKCHRNTVWKFQNFSVIQIFRETNFGRSQGSKKAVFAIFGALTFINLINFRLQKVQKCMKIMNMIQSL